MAKWLFRVLSSETFDKTNLPDNKISFLLKHPCQWNKGKWKFDPGCGLISNIEIDAETPTEIGITDPFEGYLFEEYGLSPDNKVMSIRIKGILEKRIRAVCFSSIEAEDDEIVDRIEEQVAKRKYGNHYMYFKLDGGTLHNLTLSAAKKNSVTGIASATVVTATYFYNRESRVSNGKFIFHPIHAAGGATVSGGMVGKLEAKNSDGIVIGCIDRNHEEVVNQAFMQAIPRKYGPVYDVEDEYRLLLYMPDDHVNDVVLVDFENVNNEVKLGYVEQIG